MNKFVTYSARAKLRHLLEKTDGAVAMRITIDPKYGLQVSTLFSMMAPDDIIISTAPYILTDARTLKQLSDRSIDFSYETDEFIITRDKHVVSAATR